MPLSRPRVPAFFGGTALLYLLSAFLLLAGWSCPAFAQLDRGGSAAITNTAADNRELEFALKYSF